MQITIWSDFVCPFCFIGATHLDKALESFPHADDVKIEYKSFQLEPGAKYVPGRTYKEAMVERKGAAPEQIDQMFSQVTEMAANAGLDYDFEKMKLTDTFPAHRVFKYADAEGKGVEYFNNTPIYSQIVEMSTHVQIIEQSDYHYTARSYIAAAIVNVINGNDLMTELQGAEDQLNFDMGN